MEEQATVELTTREWALILDALTAWHGNLSKFGCQNLAEKIDDITEEIKRQFGSRRWDILNGKEGLDVHL